MDNKQFLIWLATNGYTQEKLAKRLAITPQTITRYKRDGVYPEVFIMALVGLSK